MFYSNTEIWRLYYKKALDLFLSCNRKIQLKSIIDWLNVIKNNLVLRATDIRLKT